MAGLSTSDSQLHIVEETVEGTTDNDAAFIWLRHNSESLTVNANNARSAQITSDRIATGSRRLGLENRGSVVMEASNDDGLEMLLAGVYGTDWSTNVLDIGTDLKSYTFLKRFGPSQLFPQRYTGVVVNTMNLSIPEEDFATISFDVQGGVAPVETLSSGTPTYAAKNPTSAPAMRSSDVSLGWIGGLAALGSSCVTAFDLKLDNQARGQKCIGTEGEATTVLGQSLATGSAIVHFEAATTFTAFLAETTFGFVAALSDGTATLTFDAAATTCVMTNHEVTNPGNSNDLVAKIEFDVNSTSSKSITCTRSA